MGHDSVEGTEVVACSRLVQVRRPTDMPDGLFVIMLWVTASSSGFPWSE